MKYVVRILVGSCLISLVYYGIRKMTELMKKKRYEKIHGTPPGTYEVNMDDWD